MRYDAIVVGAGPNGLAAAIELRRAGLEVLLREANDTVGGAVRSMELTLPGFVHDPFSAVYPMGAGSPFLSEIPLGAYGLEWVHSPAPLAHPLGDRVVTLERSLPETAEQLGDSAKRYRSLVNAPASRWPAFAREILGPLRIPRHPFLMAGFGLHGIRSLEGLLGDLSTPMGSLLAGNAAHSGLSMATAGSAAYALVLHAAGHAVGWPIPRGGAGRLSAAMADYFVHLGGHLQCSAPVRTLDELPPARTVLLNLTPRQILAVAGSRLPPGYQDALRRFRYGPGVFKVDWALSGPIPWSSPECARAATVHLGGDGAEIAASMKTVAKGGIPERPFVILSQPSLFDGDRAPEGGHTAWGYCHLPNGATVDMTARIEAQVERFAPGFGDLILDRHVLSPAGLEKMDANLVGGDVNGGAATLDQLFTRPVARRDPYATPLPGLFICSASTPPGGAVHGMCGYHAARSAIRWLDRHPRPLERPT